jgi:aerobic carbon-monoxide dehydrogenase small subunit
MIEFRTIALMVNGEDVRETVDPRTSLVDFLRERLGLTGSHVGCEQGACGACTVRLDGVTARGCLVLAVQCAGSRVETIEGVSDAGEIADLQDAFVRRNALQCGFCTPGMLLAAQELLAQSGMPSREEIRAHLSGNYCRCTGYQAIVDAVEAVARARLGLGAGGEISDKEESATSPHRGSPAAIRPSPTIGERTPRLDERSEP